MRAMRRTKFENTKLWIALRIGQNVRVSRLAEVAKVTYEHAKSYVEFLQVHGYAKLSQNQHRLQCQLLKDTGSRAPCAVNKVFVDPNLAGAIHDPQQRMWDAMRILGTWTLPYLVDVTKVSPMTANNYSLALVKQGMAIPYRDDPKKTRGSYTAFRLTFATGPDAPILRADGSWFDANLFRAELDARYGANLRLKKEA